MTIEEAARKFRVNPNTIKMWIGKGLLHARMTSIMVNVPAHTKMIRVRQIDEAELKRYLNLMNPDKLKSVCICTFEKLHELGLPVSNHAPTCPLYKLDKK